MKFYKLQSSLLIRQWKRNLFQWYCFCPFLFFGRLGAVPRPGQASKKNDGPKTSGKPPTSAQGRMRLYFGCRYDNIDNIYKKEIAEFVQNGALSNVSFAFSRDENYPRVRGRFHLIVLWFKDQSVYSLQECTHDHQGHSLLYCNFIH